MCKSCTQLALNCFNLLQFWLLNNGFCSRTTWDEHVFEITLPKSCTIGHVCFKFSFQSTCSPPPNIEVTLLKQNVSGIGHKQPASMPVDGKVDFGLGPKGIYSHVYSVISLYCYVILET